MNLDKFTIKAQEVVQQAQQLAAENDNQAIENGHLLAAMLEVDETILPFLFQKVGANQAIVAKANERIIAGYPKVTGGQQVLGRFAQDTINKAQKFAKQIGDEYLSIDRSIRATKSTFGKRAGWFTFVAKISAKILFSKSSSPKI